MREERETRVYDFLNTYGIPYRSIDHEPANDMETCRVIEQQLGVPICKNLFLCNRQKTAFYLLMMPGDKPFKTKELSAQINSARLSFADAMDMERLLNIRPGAVSVMGLMNDKDNAVRLLVDEDILKEEYLGCHPCVSTASLRLLTADVFERFLPAVHHTYMTVKLVGIE